MELASRIAAVLLVVTLHGSVQTTTGFTPLASVDRRTTTTTRGSLPFLNVGKDSARGKWQGNRWPWTVVMASPTVPELVVSDEAGESTTTHAHDDKLWKDMLDRFQGDFDNYHQVVRDRQEGKLPREGGGHEHIHCTLIPVTKDSRLAAFYFDGQPRAIFRFRYYHLQPSTVSSSSKSGPTVPAVETYLYTLHPDLEVQLRQASCPMEWPQLFRQFQSDDDKVRLLESCQVRWTYELDAKQHSYVPDEKKNNGGIHAVMVHGEALVDSQMIPGHKILIRDQLSLWTDELWIHDRGHDPQTMAFIYGNQRGIPYRLRRVSNIREKAVVPSKDNEALPKEESLTRSVVESDDLAWTLGPEFRTESLYEEKINAMGGPSRGANGPPGRKNK